MIYIMKLLNMKPINTLQTEKFIIIHSGFEIFKHHMLDEKVKYNDSIS